MQTPSRPNNLRIPSARQAVTTILTAIPITLFVTLGYVFYQQGQADRASDTEVPGDGRISPAEWQRFVDSQVSLIAQGKDLSEEARDLFCHSRLPIGIKPHQGRQLALYCTNTTPLADR